MEDRGLSGSSENAYAVWAGPARSEDPESVVPANINARQVYMQREWQVNDIQYHLSKGVGVYGMGHLPMESIVSGMSEFPVAYLGTEYASLHMSLEFFDLDVGACGGPCPPLIIYFDTIPRTDWAMCYGTLSNCAGEAYTIRSDLPTGWGANNAWASFDFTVPGDAIGVPFYGGRLVVIHDNAAADTYGLKISVEAVPVLIE